MKLKYEEDLVELGFQGKF